MTNRKSGGFIKFLLLTVTLAAFVAAMTVSVFSSDRAYAEAPSHYSQVEIATQPSDITANYGDEEIPELKVTFNYDVVASYEWFRSDAPSSVATKVAEGTSAAPSFKPKDVTQSGYYRCNVSTLTFGGRSYSVDIKSEIASVAISPKKIGVEVSENEFVYNGARQDPIFVIDDEEIVEGDTVKAYFDTEIAPKNARTYSGKIKLDNANYAVDGNDDVTVTIDKADLKVKIKEMAVRVGRNYTLQLEYDGFQGFDTEEDLGFTPSIPEEFREIKEAGIYTVRPTGKGESDNYYLTYVNSYLYVNDWILSAEKISGADATAGGSFKTNTTMSVSVDKTAPKGFYFLKPVKGNYKLSFTSGSADGEDFIFNLSDKSISKFMLAVCYVDEDGTTHKVDNFSYKDGILSVTLPVQGEVNFVVYNDYTLVVVIGGVLLLVLIVVVVVLSVSKSKFSRHRFYYETAAAEADKYREKMSNEMDEE